MLRKFFDFVPATCRLSVHYTSFFLLQHDPLCSAHLLNNIEGKIFLPLLMHLEKQSAKQSKNRQTSQLLIYVLNEYR